MAQSPLQRAVEIVGSQTALAAKLGVPQQHVSYWLNHAKAIPAERVIPIERATDGAVSRHELRPDLYPRDEQAPVEAAD